jgi:hypothetical protein
VTGLNRLVEGRLDDAQVQARARAAAEKFAK